MEYPIIAVSKLTLGSRLQMIHWCIWEFIFLAIKSQNADLASSGNRNAAATEQKAVFFLFLFLLKIGLKQLKSYPKMIIGIRPWPN